MTTDNGTLSASLAGYARRLHAIIGPRHHVASPLGAWLLLALCAPAADGADRDALAGTLGCDVDVAAGLAAGLLAQPHPQVGSAAAAWTRPGAALRDGLARWESGLPDAVQKGPLHGQAQVDAWAREHTFGLIQRFPMRADPAVYLVLASALATRVSWAAPFELAPGSALGTASPWSGQLGQVLRTPGRRAGGGGGGGHEQFIAVTAEAGDVAVQVARARGGLVVASVAAAAGVPPADVLAIAQDIGRAAAVGADVPRRALADLPLGEAPLWRVTEEPAADGGGADAFTAVLPAWSASGDISLTDASLGFGTAVRALAGPDPWDAAQAAMARYSRTGFEAAAVSAAAVALSMRVPRPGRRRLAELRFAHPYAVVAVAVDHGARRGEPGPWHGVPVFSAWVTEPEDAAGE